MLLGLLVVATVIGPRRLIRSVTRSAPSRLPEIQRYHVRFFHAQALSLFFIVLVLPLIPISAAIKEFQSIPDFDLASKGLILLFVYSILIFVALTYSTRKADILWQSKTNLTNETENER
jgi:hypothetical protein